MIRTMKPLLTVLVVMGGLAFATSAKADPVGGRKVTYETVEARDVDVYTVHLYGKEETLITVLGDGDTDLDLYVYDEFGNLLASDIRLGDRCAVAVRPRWNGPVKIRIVNRGNVHNDYRMVVE